MLQYIDPSLVTPQHIFRVIWKAKLPGKIKFFLWQLAYGYLPITDLLAHRGMQVSPQCPLCDQREKFTTLIFRLPLCPSIMV